MEPLVPVPDGAGEAGYAAPASAPVAEAPPVDVPAAPAATARAKAQPVAGEPSALSFDDPAMDWRPDEDPFADLGPVDPRPPAGGSSPASGAGEPDKPR